MNYSDFSEFPFPSVLTEESARVKSFFMSLTDSEQLRLLNGSKSYDDFYSRVVNRIAAKKNAGL